MWFYVRTTLRSFYVEADSLAGAQRAAELVSLDGETVTHEPKLVASFASEQEARERFWDDLGDEDFVDNFRIAYEDDKAAMAAYEAQQADGCCGSFDATYIVAGRFVRIGCNYGH